MTAGTHLRCLSDAAFRNEDDSGHALKGAAFMRTTADPSSYSNAEGHLIDWMCGRQRHVTRGVFSSEVFGVCDAADRALLLA